MVIELRVKVTAAHNADDLQLSIMHHKHRAAGVAMVNSLANHDAPCIVQAISGHTHFVVDWLNKLAPVTTAYAFREA